MDKNRGEEWRFYYEESFQVYYGEKGSFCLFQTESHVSKEKSTITGKSFQLISTNIQSPQVNAS